MKKRILIIEDEEKIAKVLKIELSFEGYEVFTAYNGKSGLQSAFSLQPDCILLDVMLPEMSGIDVLKKLRQEDAVTPVILLTARTSTLDKVHGLDHGANDYITKPFEIEELLARIRAAMRQIGAAGTKAQDARTILGASDLSVNTETREVIRGERTLTLTPTEFELLVYLLINKNKIVTREGILTNVWGYEYEGETNIIDVYIRYLRKKIDQEGEEPLITTVRGVGYMIKDKK
ncbi:response regulator transcription factor [Metabacillus sp. GX 13764]|uniref:response regulator transcription factor n=1 Tax=Metabacillus kandeliae TaxID=2900151 RepID=UPI001E4ADB59|nr:response regulator transcription factor [Metabacillus kandeliae]MCD7035671.1 response regulator transcription factor [Metabacillus kandeliae]